MPKATTKEAIHMYRVTLITHIVDPTVRLYQHSSSTLYCSAEGLRAIHASDT